MRLEAVVDSPSVRSQNLDTVQLETSSLPLTTNVITTNLVRHQSTVAETSLLFRVGLGFSSRNGVRLEPALEILQG